MTEVTLDHELLMSSLHTESERALATSALGMHEGSALRVLVGGLGLGCTAHAVLESTRVGTLCVIERLPEVIRWMREGLVPLAPALMADARLQIEEGDVYALLAERPVRRWDLILIDVDHSPDEPLDPVPGAFHTEAGLAGAGHHLAAGGVLGVWSSARDPAFEQAMQQAFADARVEEVAFLNRHFGQRQSDWLYFARAPRRGA